MGRSIAIFCTCETYLSACVFLLQAALGSWVPLCEAVASWRMIQDEGLRNEINVIMQAFRANLVCILSPPASNGAERMSGAFAHVLLCWRKCMGECA